MFQLLLNWDLTVVLWPPVWLYKYSSHSEVYGRCYSFFLEIVIFHLRCSYFPCSFSVAAKQSNQNHKLRYCVSCSSGILLLAVTFCVSSYGFPTSCPRCIPRSIWVYFKLFLGCLPHGKTEPNGQESNLDTKSNTRPRGIGHTGRHPGDPSFCIPSEWHFILTRVQSCNNDFIINAHVHFNSLSLFLEQVQSS